MNPETIPAAIGDKSVLRQLIELYQMAEFFVMRKFRRQAVGKRVAFDLFDRLPAKWEVRQVQENTAGIQFWRSILTIATRNSAGDE